MVVGVITAIEPQHRRGGRRRNVYVDGRYAFSVASEVATTLRVGQAISPDEAQALLSDDELGRCFEAVLRFLGPRPRSEREVRQRLSRHEFAQELIDRAVEKVRGLGLIDDTAFAEYWIDQRQTHRPRGARLLKLELRQKGLDGALAGRAVGDLGDEAATAYRAAARRAASLRGLDERTFKQRLGGFLQRRGFEYESSAAAIRRLWAEIHGGVGGSAGSEAPDTEV